MTGRRQQKLKRNAEVAEVAQRTRRRARAVLFDRILSCCIEQKFVILHEVKDPCISFWVAGYTLL
jgi:hypothetical protein